MAPERDGPPVDPAKYWASSSRHGSQRSGSRSQSGLSRSVREAGSSIVQLTSGIRSTWGLLGSIDNPLERSQASRREAAMDDEEALKWAALERLPTVDRVFTSVMHGTGGGVAQVDVRDLSPLEKQELLDKLLKAAENETGQILRKMRKRLDKVGIELPTIEVRYENLSVEAECYVGDRALPTLWNAFRNTAEGWLGKLGLPLTKLAKLSILEGVNGIIKPGRMTLLLGPPSSGKTTLLLALAGKLDKALKVRGLVTFNGHTHDEFVASKTAVYISQHDLHTGEMTVRETLNFSAQCQGTGTRYDMLEEISRREKEAGIYPEADVDAFMKASAIAGQKSSIGTDYTLRLLGLDVCADTMIGDQMRRGISGGQKKRVTTGEMIVGPVTALFMDEISTGLDSSTTFSIVKNLGQIAHVMKSTIIVSLLQPAPETFDLFDDIILLSEGQVVYHGPREHIVSFFESCGFRCPERKGVADFLQEVTSRKDQEQYWVNTHRPYRFIPVRELAEMFKRFHVGSQMLDELSEPFDKERSHKAALATEKYATSKFDLFKAVFNREWLLMKRNSVVTIFKCIQIVISAFISMTTYFRTNLKQDTVADGTVYLGALFYAIVCIMFGGFGEMAMTITRLPVVIKQRDFLFYPAWTYSVSAIVLSIPSSALASLVWVGMTYYVTGYAPEAERFFRQMFILFLVEQMSGAMFRFIGGLCRTMLLANTLGFMVILMFFMLGGFLIPRPQIKKWWIWGFWISPLSYAEQAISTNEMLAPRWQKPGPNNMTVGVATLLSRGQYPYAYWYWIGVGGLVAFIFLFNLGFTLALSYMPALGKPQAVVTEDDLALKEASKASEGRGGEPVLTRDERAHDMKLRRSRRSPSVTATSRRISRANGDDAQLTRSNRTSDRQMVKPIAERGMVLPFEPLSISFDDICYYVDLPAEMKRPDITETRLKLLSNITGSFRPGVLTALVGVSGAGKTTLMDVLAGRKTGGYIEGDIRISGFPKNQATFSRIAGYCEQNDIHSPQMTVHESLIYSAWLRLLPEVPDHEKTKFVEEVMDLVELQPLRDALVGLPGLTGLSTEQRKRLTIAVELVANPSIIFMDEPTSGLDARAAAIVMRTVRNTVDTGRTVVCTIHQPSIDIFEAFDELLLLKRGGQTIYNGPLGERSHHLIEYFEAFPGVPKCPDGYNPATWMLEATSMSMESELGVDFAELYANSSLFQNNMKMVQDLKVPEPGMKDLFFPTPYSQPALKQLKIIMWKQFVTYWRSPDYNLVRYAFTIFAAVIFGSLFWQIGANRSNSNDLFTVVGALYGSTMFISFNNCGAVQPVVSVERTVFYREKAAGLYSAMPYAMAQVLVEIPYVVIQAIMYSLVIYSMVGFEWTAVKFFWFLYVLFFSLISFTYYGMMMVAITPNTQLATISGAFFYSLFNLFSGFLIFRPKIPVWWIWYYWICPLAWTLNGLITSQFGDLHTEPLTISDSSANITNVAAYVKTTFGYEESFMKYVAIMLFGWAAFFAFIFVLGIKKLNFQTR